MIAMAVVSHQCAAGTSDERGNKRMEEEDDLLSRLRYLRQTLQDCHMRVSVLDERVESLHSLDVGQKDASTPTQKLVDENGTSTKHPQMLFGFMNGSQTHEGITKSQELEDDSILQFGETDFESYSPRTELHGCLTDNHLKHLAQKHASEIFNMYWSRSTDQKNDPECSSEKRQVKKVVTWSDEYEIFPYVSETCDHLESFATSNEYNDVGENWVEVDKHDESYDKINGSEKGVSEDLIDEDECTHNSQSDSEYYWHVQMDSNLTDKSERHERITEVHTTDSEIKNMDDSRLDCSKTRDEENTETEKKEIVSQSILNDIKNPWFRKPQGVSEDSGDKLHSKRRRHTLLRTKKIDFDDHDVEDTSTSDLHIPTESMYKDDFNLKKSADDSERKEDYKSLTESDEIVIKDVSPLEDLPEETNHENSTNKFNQCENEEESDEESLNFEFKVASTEEMESENSSDNSVLEYSSEDDISVSKKNHNTSEAILLKIVNEPEAEAGLKSKAEDSHLLSNIRQPIHDRNHKFVSKNVDVDSDEFSKLALPAYYMSSSLIINRQDLLNLKESAAKLKMRCNRVESNENIRSGSILRANRGCNTDPVLNQRSSWDPKSLIAILIMFLLLFAALFIMYLIITVPLLVVSIRHNGSSVAI